MSGPLSFIDGSSCSTCSAAAGSSRATACAYPELQAVVRDAPRSFSPAAARSPFTAFPCQLAPLHLASALGRDGCVRALLEAGASPFVWTRPPPPAAPAGGGGAEGGAAAAAAGADAGDDDDHFSSYEGVCSSGVYQSLKQLLPSSSEFPYTFTLAQQLLRTPCSPLLLAVRFGRLAAAQALLEAMEGGRAAADAAAAAAAAGGGVEERGGADGSASGGGDGDAAPDLVLTPSFATASAAASQASAGSGLGAAPEPHVELLRRLLGAGGSGCARPLRRLLPAILARYDNCNPQSGMADKLREGLREVLAHVLPPGEEGGGSGGGGCAWRDGMPPPAPPALRQLLTAAVVCRDEARCGVLLAALDASCPAPWADVAANCALLAAAAAHDMAGVVEGLLARPPPPPGDGMPPFNANMWGPDGLSVLMTAAHRGSLAALQALLAAGAAVNLADEMGCTALGWGVVGNSQEAVVMLAQHGAAIDHFGVVHEEEEHLERALLTATARRRGLI
ncbi:expressed protein [Chlorella variabilis]|uniref:Expressed protein n=1 Tax=Chlorella variabilis TaxID=554065 RepID=E1ZI18_CHLVA|nr:expressed protein [Chlorella variabilis]EFN54558.1 expressed protein [Chlorella variabilis]|eukprot:XP_005846660.1 expressed protein [Chlorella variabilis]